MTALTERTRGSRANAKGAPSLLVPGSLPQVNLLPPEVRAARGLRVLKRWLAVGLVVVLTVCVMAYAAALLVASSARAELTEAQDATAALQAEQLKYAEVPVVLNALTSTKAARELGMSTEVAWKPYLDALAAVLPADVSIETLSITGATPVTAGPIPGDPLQAPSMGSIEFSGRTAEFLGSPAWVDALESIPGLSSARVTSVSVGESEGTTFYTIGSTIQFTESAYLRRFVATTEGAS